MKSKMKSTFAIIAVALMVMVAVVPMVSVFTSEIDAAVPENGDPDLGEKITISGKVLNIDGTNVADATYKVLIKYGPSSEYTVKSANYVTSGAYEIVVKDTVMTRVSVSIIDADGDAVPEFTPVTFDKLTTGSYTANLISTASTTGEIGIALVDGTKTLTDLYAGATVIQVFYKLYSDAACTREIRTTSGVATLDDNKITVDYTGTFTEMYVKVVKVSATIADVTYTTEALKNATGAKIIGTEAVATFKLDQAMFILNADNTANKPFPASTISISKAYATKTAEDDTEYASSSIKAATVSVLEYGGSLNYFYDAKFDGETLLAITKLDMTATFSDAVKDVRSKFELTTNFAPAGYYGEFGMGSSSTIDVSGYDGQSFKIKVDYKQTSATLDDITGSVELTPFVDDGKYVALYKQTLPDGYTAETDDVTVSWEEVNAVYIGKAATAGKVTNQAPGYTKIVIDKSNYTLINGTIKDESSPTAYAPMADLGITLTGVKSAFGAEVSTGSTTITSKWTDNPTRASQTNTFKIFVEKLSQVTPSPASGEVFELTAATSQPVVVDGATLAMNLVIKAKEMTFIFTNDDGDPITTAVTLNFPKDSNMYDVYTTHTVSTVPATDVAYTGVHTVKVTESYIDLTKTTFWTTKDSYKFANSEKSPLTYSENVLLEAMLVSSLDKGYAIQLKDVDGSIKIYGTSAFTVKAYPVHISEGGSYVFGAASATYVATPDSTGVIYVTIPKSFVNVTLGASVKTVAILEPTDVTGSLNVLPYYFAETDSKDGNIITVQVLPDSFSAKILKRDGVTPIGGVKVQIFKTVGAAAPVDISVSTVVSDSDGDFTVYAKEKIDETVEGTTYTLKMTSAKAKFVDTNIVSNGERIDYVVSEADKYTIKMKDADNKEFIVYSGDYATAATENKVTMTLQNLYADTTVTSSLNTLSAFGQWDVGTVISPVLESQDDTPTKYAVRTFSPYTITADDIASGTINLVTNESTYKMTVQDSKGTAIIDYNADVYKMQNGVDLGSVTVDEIELANGTTFIGQLIPNLDYTTDVILTDIADSSITYAAYITQADDYAFANKKVSFENKAVTVKSTYTEILFALEDADGKSIAVPAEFAGKVMVAGSFTGPIEVDTAPATNTMFFIGDASKTYVPYAAAYDYDAWTIGGYTFSTLAVIVDGAINANEGAVTFAVTDAIGTPIGVTDKAIALASYFADGTKIADVVEFDDNVKISDAGEFTVVFDSTFAAMYSLQIKDYCDATHHDLSFDYSTNAIFVADQTIIVPTIRTANGVNLMDVVIEDKDVTPYATDGTLAGTIGATDHGKIGLMYVDLSKLAYYSLENGIVPNYTFDLQLTSDFIANESLISGSLPFGGEEVEEQKLNMDFLYEGNVVMSYDNLTSNKVAAFGYEYVAIIDLTDFVIDGALAGVAFDQIVMTYYEDGIMVATASIDPFTQINNIYAPGHDVPILYTVINKTEGVCAGHTVAYVLNNVLILSADSVFYTADEGYYTDGQYKYTFAGWYVNGVKVSANPDYAENIDSNVVAAAQYDVTYEKISDVNAEKEKEIVEKEVPVGIDTNVLIIGICAVVIALIAVVYAVIKKE